MMQMTQEQYMFAYIEARRAKVPRLEQGRVERAGFYLLDSARGSDDGEAVVSQAICRALAADEVEAALEIADQVVPDFEIEPDPRYRSRCNGNFGKSGEIVV